MKPVVFCGRAFGAADLEQIRALIAAAAWKTAPRDAWIGWTPRQRQERFHLSANNARFLILPWVNSRHLASKILALAARQIPQHWQTRYGYRAMLLETFVEKARFAGTCWLYLGDTQGRGKLDVHHQHALPVEAVFVYPLACDARRRLTH